MTASPQTPQPDGVDHAIMAARYGQPASDQVRRRRRTIIGVIVGLVLVAAIIVQAVGLSRPSVVTEYLGFTVESPTQTSVRFNVITEPGTTLRCTIVAVNESFTEVGWREVVVGPVTETTTSHEALVTTSEMATSGSVNTCEIVDAG